MNPFHVYFFVGRFDYVDKAFRFVQQKPCNGRTIKHSSVRGLRVKRPLSAQRIYRLCLMLIERMQKMRTHTFIGNFET